MGLYILDGECTDQQCVDEINSNPIDPNKVLECVVCIKDGNGDIYRLSIDGLKNPEWIKIS